jgi:membrane associated rhomboid family serine protease
MPSYLFLGLWFGYQLLLGFLSGAQGGGVAYFAHIGGFVLGVLLALPFKFTGRRDKIEFRVS